MAFDSGLYCAHRPRLAVVGTGISGLATAWLLRQRYDVTLFERNDYVGGHTHTVAVDGPDGPVAVDTGFIVFNRRNYPHLSALFGHLGIASQPSDMSFAASVDDGRIEYAGSGLGTLFAQGRHLVSPRFYGMLRDILRFNRHATRLLAQGWDEPTSLGLFLKRLGLGDAFRDHYLLPMAAAIWSCPCSTMLDFPAHSLLRFFHNHGLLGLSDRPQWRTVSGGSWRYVGRLLQDLNAVRCSTPVRAVVRRTAGLDVITDDGASRPFDQVVVATHADEARTLLADPDPLEGRLLGAFRYQPNRAVLHTDARLMPRRRRVWSAWNYLARTDAPDREPRVSVTYWMNCLQRLTVPTPYLVSLNPLTEPDPDKVLREMAYTHPVLDGAAMAAQRRLGEIQGRGGLWFAGSYFGYGFHEDGMRSAVQVAHALGAELP
ncbi:MAG: FAD-dependent oxidoreductase, partial [Gammaproteobacteria bacterium]